eukprot:462249-Rhodomonas_salina.3
MEENEATLTVSLKMPKHILAMQATNVSAYINWRDQLRERLHSRNAAGSATKLRFSEFNESSPDRERPRTASPSRTRTPPRSPPRSPDKDLVHGVSSPTRTPQRSPDRGESIHDFPSRPGSAAAESRRNPELGEYWNGSESETSFLLPASPADSSKRGSKGQVRVPARQVQHYVQGMVESYQALLRRKSVGSVESPGMDYRNGPSVGLLKVSTVDTKLGQRASELVKHSDHQKLDTAQEAVLLDENNKLQETVLQLTDQLRLTRKANIELQKQAASLASTANEALTQAEILRFHLRLELLMQNPHEKWCVKLKCSHPEDSWSDGVTVFQRPGNEAATEAKRPDNRELRAQTRCLLLPPTNALVQCNSSISTDRALVEQTNTSA